MPSDPPGANLRGSSSTAVWLPDDVSYAATMAVDGPAFHRHSAKTAGRRLPGTALAHGASVARMRRRGMPARHIASALVWLETARYYGFTQVLDLEGNESAVTELLTHRRPREPRRRGGTRPSLTGALIATNEQSTIAGALESLAPFVDELVVLDGGSTDATVEIARSYGATVHHRRFDRDFAAQRNALLEHVRTPWVFMLDCDERVPAQLATEVVAVLGSSDIDAVVMPRLNLVDDDPIPTRWPDPHARVHRTKLRYRRPVHEYVVARSAIYLPLNGPCVQHHKTSSRSYRQLRLYDSIDPTQTTSLDVERMVRWRDEDPAAD